MKRQSGQADSMEAERVNRQIEGGLWRKDSGLQRKDKGTGEKALDEIKIDAWNGDRKWKGLDEPQWRAFQVADLFDIKIGKSIDGNKVDKEAGRIAYITRRESNNGLDGFIAADEALLNEDFPVITIGNETAEPFVQGYPFFTGTKVNILIPKKALSKHTLLFITCCLRMHKSKYSYCYTVNSTRLRKQMVLLPAGADGQPDYDFMEQYMRQVERKILRGYLHLRQDADGEIEG